MSAPGTTTVTVVYYSATGNVHELALSIVAGARAAGADVRLRKVAELAPQSVIDSNPAWVKHRENADDVQTVEVDDVLWADAVIFGSPTRFGNVSAQLKQFVDTLGGPWSRGELADKVYSGFTSTDTWHGGQESTLLALYNSIYHFGGVLVTPGYTDPIKFTDGNPYGTSHVTGGGELAITDETRQAAEYQGRRVARMARALRVGLAAL